MTQFKKNLVKTLGGFLLAGTLLSTNIQAQEKLIMDVFPNPHSTELAINHNYQELNPIEKTAYLEDRSQGDTSREYIKKIPGALCGNYVGQMWVNFDGDSTLNPNEIPFEYYYEENGKENIQTFNVGFSLIGNPAHAVNGFAINDTLTSTSSFYIYDNSKGKRVYLDSLEKNIDLGYEIDTSESVTVHHINGFNTAGFPNTKFMLRFKYINGNLELTDKDPSVVLTNPALDNEEPITEYSFKDTITNNPDNLVLNYDFHDGEYLETISWEFYNSSISRFDIAYYDFYSGHFLDSGFFQINSQEKENFEFSQNKVPTNPSSALLPVYNQSGEIPLDKSEGEHQVIVNVTDYGAKNTAKDTIKYVIDITPPNIDIIYPESKDYVGKVDSMVVAVSDANPGDTIHYNINGADYSVAYSDTITVNTTSIEGQNKYSVSAPDEAGNPAYAEVNFNIIPDAVEKKTLESYFRFYPNPTKDIGNFEFYLDAPKNLKFSVYDITGKQLEGINIEGNSGDNKISYDFSEYNSGVYIYKLGKKTGKVIKR